MAQYIKENFSDFLKEDAKLLDLPNGMDLLKDKYLKIKEKASKAS
jgi:hypothetical protein